LRGAPAHSTFRAMADDLIRYDILAQDALRGLLRQVLSEVAQTGLPGEHHFFITFATRAPGVRISQRLRGQYPEEITVVLQHQFWDLTVTESAFEVGLSFNGIPERLVVPFRAVKAFVDPHASFGLKFDMPLAAEEEKAADAAAAEQAAPEAAEPPVGDGAPAAEAEPAPKAGEGADVVSLDQFRKKS
jgi:uncharacterized protein